MSWAVDKNTKAVTMHQGDTGSFWENLNLKSGNDFQDGDVAIFEMWKDGDREPLIHREFNLQPDEPTDINPGNGRFLIAFRNSDTDTLAPGSYPTELKVVLVPVRNNGKVLDGNCVRTVWQSTVQINPVYIKV